MSDLIPEYLSIDFDTLVNRLRTQIQESDKFTDINYEGSNLNVLIELFAYIAELNTYYVNKLAKNQFIDTADIYENVHRLSTLLGYTPKGYISSTGTVDITATGSSIANKKIILENWTQLQTGNITDEDGNTIYYTTTEVQEASASGNTVTFSNVPVKQGKIIKYDEENSNAFSYSDIKDNKIMLPLYNFDYDNSITDNYKSVRLFVDGEEWTRINNFYDDISGLSNLNKVYRFEYNKYKQYYIEFSIYRDCPSSNSQIEIWLLNSLGADGNVAAGSINSSFDTEFLIDQFGNIIDLADLDSLTINNSSATTGGKNPQSIDDIKEWAKRTTHTQYRNVTKSDYKTYLELHNNVEKAGVWGEQEQNPNGGNIFDYNKVYISLIPNDDPSTWSDKIYTISHVNSNDTTIYIPVTSVGSNGYYSSYVDEISTYLEPRKMLTAYEEYVAPDLIYFKFDVSIKIRSNYNYLKVLKDLKRKLQFYFNASNREFNETIEFTDIINKMLDRNYVDNNNDDDFEQTHGLLNFVIRDIDYLEPIDKIWYTPNNEGSSNYPRFTNVVESNWTNEIRNIELGLNQFPFIDINSCTWKQIT